MSTLTAFLFLCKRRVWEWTYQVSPKVHTAQNLASDTHWEVCLGKTLGRNKHTTVFPQNTLPEPHKQTNTHADCTRKSHDTYPKARLNVWERNILNTVKVRRMYPSQLQLTPCNRNQHLCKRGSKIAILFKALQLWTGNLGIKNSNHHLS